MRCCRFIIVSLWVPHCFGNLLCSEKLVLEEKTKVCRMISISIDSVLSLGNGNLLSNNGSVVQHSSSMQQSGTHISGSSRRPPELSMGFDMGLWSGIGTDCSLQ